MDNALRTLPEGSEEAAKYPQEVPATIASYAANDGKPGKADETSSPHLRFKLSPVCTKNARVTWHPAPSPPQHRDALTCPIPDTLSKNEPNAQQFVTEHIVLS